MTDDVEALLEVRDLTVTFGGNWRKNPVTAIDGVSFDLMRGETLGIVGESGSGKSTTARAILRLVEVASGTVRFRAQDALYPIRKVPLSYRRSVQAVFQDPASSLNPRHTVGRAVEDSLRRHGVSKKNGERQSVLLRAFERVGLTAAHLDRLPSELSGGQQQRVAIARALALNSEVVICDEAVSALDLSTQAQVINLLDGLQAESDLSFLFIAHDLGVVRDICDRIVVMYLGRVVEVGTREQLFGHPRHPYTRALLAATPASHPDGRDGRRRRRLAHNDGRVYTTPPRGSQGCPFRTRCSHVTEECDTTPIMQTLNDGSQVACHLYADGQPVEIDIRRSSREVPTG